MIIGKPQRVGVERASLSSSFHKQLISIVSIAGRSLPPIVGLCLPLMIRWMITINEDE